MQKLSVLPNLLSNNSSPVRFVLQLLYVDFGRWKLSLLPVLFHFSLPTTFFFFFWPSHVCCVCNKHSLANNFQTHYVSCQQYPTWPHLTASTPYTNLPNSLSDKTIITLTTTVPNAGFCSTQNDANLQKNLHLHVLTTHTQHHQCPSLTLCFNSDKTPDKTWWLVRISRALLTPSLSHILFNKHNFPLAL